MLKSGYTYLFFDITVIYSKESFDVVKIVDDSIERFTKKFGEIPDHLIIPNRMNQLLEDAGKEYNLEISVLPENSHQGMLYVGKEIKELV